MPKLSKAVQDSLALIADEKARQEAVALFEKHPSLAELNVGGLRQEDYDKAMNAWKQEKAAIEAQAQTAMANVAKYQKWWEENKPIFDNVKADALKFKTERDEFEQKVKELQAAAAAGGDKGAAQVDVSQVVATLEERFAKKGWLSKTDFENAFKAEVEKVVADQRKRLDEEVLPSYGNYIMSVWDMVARHQAEFGKPMDRMAFQKFLAERNVQKIDEIPKFYEEFTVTARNELATKKLLEEKEKEWATKHGVPGAGSGAAAAPPQINPAIAGLLPSTGAGDGKLGAAAAADSLRQEGKI